MVTLIKQAHIFAPEDLGARDVVILGEQIVGRLQVRRRQDEGLAGGELGVLEQVGQLVGRREPEHVDGLLDAFRLHLQGY